MVSNKDIEKWNSYRKNLCQVFDYGRKNGLIYPIEDDEEFMESLRHFTWGGMRLSVLLLCEKMTNGFCYDRSILFSFGFGNDDFRRVYASIDGIKLRPDYLERYQSYSEEEKKNVLFGDHCYMERVREDGTVWIYDPSQGFVYRKDIYEQIEHPVLRKTVSKENVISSFEYQDILREDIDYSKYALFLLVPVYEALLVVGQPFHKEALKRELDLYKSEIHYEKIVEEEKNKMKKIGLLA